MRIVYFSDTYWPRINGVTVSIDTARRELQILGHEVLVVAPAYPGCGEDPGVLRLPGYQLPYSKDDWLMYKLRTWPALCRRLDAFQPEILHSHTEFSSLNLAWRYGLSRKVPLVSTSHTMWEHYVAHYMSWLPPWFARFAAKLLLQMKYQRPALIVCPSRAMAETLERYGIKVPKVIIPTGLSGAEFHPEGRRDGRAAGTKVLFFAGRLSQEKNPDFLLDLMLRLRPRHPGLVLKIAGDGNHRAALEARCRREGLEGAVEFLGFVPRHQMRPLYAGADVFVFPSKTETQGLVTVEAMLCGTPVVAIGAAGTLEVMNGDHGGYMTPDDLGAFAAAVEGLISDPALWAAKSAEALAYARGWTAEVLTRRLLTAYEELLARSPQKNQGS